MLEAAGYRVHVYTSPHLVRFHERIRLAGELIDEERAARAARGVRAGERRRADHLLRDHDRGGLPRLRAHAGRHPAARDRPRRAARCDQCHRAAAGDGRSRRSRSTTCSILGDTLAKIAFEKAGIMKRGVPVVVGAAAARGAGRLRGPRRRARRAALPLRRRNGPSRRSAERSRLHRPAGRARAAAARPARRASDSTMPAPRSPACACSKASASTAMPRCAASARGANGRRGCSA